MGRLFYGSPLSAKSRRLPDPVVVLKEEARRSHTEDEQDTEDNGTGTSGHSRESRLAHKMHPGPFTG